MVNGIINVYKEAGFTSFDVVAKLRGITKQRKIGHTGTLDPDATGVLPVCLGNATRLVDMLTDKTKEYVATFELGIITDTQDISGTVLEKSEISCTQEDVVATVDTFIGTISQVPPMYSAIKVDGKRLYELAREGKEVERKAREITIHEIEILDIQIPTVTIRVLCSKGTYIRTLCYDIGKKLGCGATMTSLKRTRSGSFTIEKALTLAQIETLVDEGRLSEAVLSTDVLFGDCAYVTLEGELLRLALNGNMLAVSDIKDCISEKGDRSRLRLYDENNCFFALYKKRGSKYIVDKMFL